jgi:hypothetical protein
MNSVTLTPLRGSKMMGALEEAVIQSVCVGRT